jgi:hypothetical protein
MSRRTMLRLGALGAVLLLPISTHRFGTASAGVTPASYGPPFLSLEVPPNPMRQDTREAALVVRVFHHGSPAGYKIQGRAEGLVDGERRSIRLDLEPTSDTGVYSVRRQWPTEGEWILAIGVAEHAEATLLVEMGPNGGVKPGKYYHMSPPVVSLASVQVVQGDVDERQVDSALTAMARAE